MIWFFSLPYKAYYNQSSKMTLGLPRLSFTLGLRKVKKPSVFTMQKISKFFTNNTGDNDIR